MGGKYGVKNLKEVLTLGTVVTVCIVKEVLKDGFQVTDLGAFLKSPEFEAAVKPAVEGVEQVPLEATELDLFDGLELSRHAYTCVTQVLDVFKKKA
jgi:hypothetical protein